MRIHFVRAIAAATMTVAPGACAHPAQSPSVSGGAGASVTGTVTYREPVALPPNAVVAISIVDASAADSASSVIASDTVPAQGRQLPLPFAVHYDPHRIDQRHLYVIRATIRSGGETLFATDIVRSVISQGNPTSLDLVLSRVDPGVAAASSGLAGSSWVLTDLNGAGVVSDTRVTLDFGANGRATGTGSCNRYFATVEISASSIRFGAVGSTRMACATPVSLQEVQYFAALEAANRFSVDGDVLSIYGSTARAPMRLRRVTP